MKGFLILLLCFPVLCVTAQKSFSTTIAETVQQLKCPPADEREPVTLNAQLVNTKDSIAIIVKVAIAPGWHIYEFVPSTLPYIAIERILQAPENIRLASDWEKTNAGPSVNDPGVLIYETEAVFVHKAVKLDTGKKDNTIRAGLYYQTCNLRQCLPPVEKVFELKF
jgi:DsbC/DsbD-like thiol-disulfide interchange protein